ncbi:MAG: acetyl-CoA carboxylase biotin carboxyl carrier protein [Alphaproteobacteria bacterium]|nr:acetyl-CoA carboxylase biotin carboxyl carrier protein [Alphaproteobacteria bacterium]
MAKLPDKKTIKELADLLADTGLSEIEVETGEVRIRVARQGVAVNAVVPAPVAAPVAAPAAAAASSASGAGDLAGALKSPMVGTAYLSPEPGAANFVKVGDSVSEGQTLLIVEAMKTMNPIAANKSGKITQIIVGNEQPVEFDEVLMIIE